MCFLPSRTIVCFPFLCFRFCFLALLLCVDCWPIRDVSRAQEILVEFLVFLNFQCEFQSVIFVSPILECNKNEISLLHHDIEAKIHVIALGCSDIWVVIPITVATTEYYTSISHLSSPPAPSTPPSPQYLIQLAEFWNFIMP